MADPDLEVHDVAPPSRSPCAFCLQPVEAEPRRTCPRCLAVYHPDCWKANDERCAIYGCERDPAPAAAGPALRRPPLRREPVLAPPRNWNWTATSVLVPLVIVAVNIFRLASPPSTPKVPNPRIELARLREGLREEERAIRLIADARQFLAMWDGRDGLPADLVALRKEADGLVDNLRRARASLLNRSTLPADPSGTLLLSLNEILERVENMRTELHVP